MGASAALCMALSRWFSAQSLLNSQTVEEFATTLEHLFHGKSSGLDIAGTAAEEGVYFQQGYVESIKPAWRPHWYLSFCGEKGITSHCIRQVQELWVNEPQEAQKIDHKMQNAVKKAKAGLTQFNSDSLMLLQEAVILGAQCFREWGLINKILENHIDQLMSHGAIAVKPTGSGGGGYVLSLWKKPPSSKVFNDLELMSLND